MDVAVQADNATDITSKMFRNIRHEVISTVTKLQLCVLSALYSASAVRVVVIHLQEVFVSVSTFPFFWRYQAGAGVILYVAYGYITPTNHAKDYYNYRYYRTIICEIPWTQFVKCHLIR